MIEEKNPVYRVHPVQVFRVIRVFRGLNIKKDFDWGYAPDPKASNISNIQITQIFKSSTHCLERTART